MATMYERLGVRPVVNGAATLTRLGGSLMPPPVMEAMRADGIGTGVHDPAVHLFSFYREQGWRDGVLPHAERIGRGLLTLPLFESMRDVDVERVCASLAGACRRLSS